MSSYFRNIPDFEYVSRESNSKKISDYRKVKNLFKRGKLKNDIFKDLTKFTKYKIVGDDRPDNVAFDMYGDETLDWIVLLSNNVTNIQTEWPLDHQSFYNFLIDKYGSEEQIHSVHHYETTEVRNTDRAIIVPAGLEVPQNYSIEFYDSRLETTTTVSNITTEITNYTYENKIEDEKRNIFVLKPNYINLILNDMEDAMTYKEGSTQYVSETLIKGENIRLYS
tara:strand:+ start:3714 stop:4382 length:669 start_codon:yes stop_codon:yes gene_type:complete